MYVGTSHDGGGKGDGGGGYAVGATLGAVLLEFKVVGWEVDFHSSSGTSLMEESDECRRRGCGCGEDEGDGKTTEELAGGDEGPRPRLRSEVEEDAEEEL